MNAIPCITWVKRGAAQSRPDRVKLSEDELSNLLKSAGADEDEEEDSGPESEDKDSDEEKESKPTPGKRKKGTDSESADEVVDRYDLDDYSDDESEGEQEKGDSQGLAFSGETLICL